MYEIKIRKISEEEKKKKKVLCVRAFQMTKFQMQELKTVPSGMRAGHIHTFQFMLTIEQFSGNLQNPKVFSNILFQICII